MRPTKSTSWFTRFAKATSRVVGRPAAFILATGLVVVWGLSGPIFSYSEEWQLVINTATTIVTFLMVFLIQNTQNRDSEAIHIKLDELIRVSKGAQNALLNLEELEEEELDSIREKYVKVAENARADLRSHRGRTSSPDGKRRFAFDKE